MQGPKTSAEHAKSPTVKKSKKLDGRKRRKGRHAQRQVGTWHTFPKRPMANTHPFETTLDF